MNKEYVWIESRTDAHNILLPGVLRVFDDQKIPFDSQILDAGCGGGYILHELYRAGYSNLWGIDFSPSGIQLAKNGAVGWGNRFSSHDVYVQRLPSGFPVAQYSAVLSVEVIEHLFDPKKYLQNIHSWMKSDGLLVLTTPYHGYLKNLAISVLNKWDTHHTVDWDIGHIKFFSKATLGKMLLENGFEPIGFYGLGRCWGLWNSMLIVARKN